MSYQEKVKEAIQYITDVFTCADGGMDYINFKNTMEIIAIEADRFDDNSAQVCDILLAFRKLVKVTSGR